MFLNIITDMKWPSLQFKVRGLLLATFWMSICFTALAMVARMQRLRVSSPFETPLLLVIMFAPFVAVGALFSRTILGGIIGLVALSTFWFVFYLT